MSKKQKLGLTWIGKEHRPKLEPRILLGEKLASQKQIKTVEAQRNDKRHSLFDARDAIDQQREDLIGKIEGSLKQRTATHGLFTLRWRLV